MENFTAIRNGIRTHMKAGDLNPFDLGIYIFLLLSADWGTGIYEGCALTIAFGFGDARQKAHIQRSLHRLRDRRYVNYRKGDGKRAGFPILIHKYEPTVGTLSGTRLDAWKHGQLVIPEYESKNTAAFVAPRSCGGENTVTTPYQDFDNTLQDSKKTSRRKNASRPMPHDFQPNRAHHNLAAELGVDLPRAFIAFWDYHRSKGSTFVDWGSALNGWIRRENQFAKGKDNGINSSKQRQRFDNNRTTIANVFRNSSSAGAGSDGTKCAGGDNRGSDTGTSESLLVFQRREDQMDISNSSEAVKLLAND